MLDRPTSEQTQAELLRRIAAQDREALAQFYDEMAGVLFSTAVRILGDALEAEEAVQDVFVQIWNKAATFDFALGLPLHWALGITRNRCVDRLRARKRRSYLLRELAEEGMVDPVTPVAESGRALSADESAAVRSAVGGLPREQRQAIEMAFFGGMTHPEIAEALHEPLGTIKARIRRGMLKLRENLQAYL
ncbi:MAG: sigma-70 family RNA polymerase sigma factor [Verrucomicrobia subdivision 3 bacterium]|nr:sigma-70 family RNA polymerase sigma factor [Limisphaerales bacterium]